MSGPRLSSIITLCVLFSLIAPSSFFAQDAQQTRPRRVEGPAQSPPPTPNTSTDSIARLTAEPLIRVGLATSARAVNISTTGRLATATGESESFTPLAAQRVRLEPRLLGPQPLAPVDATYQVEIAGAATRVDAERAAREIQGLTGKDSEISSDPSASTWRVRVGARLSFAEAEELRARLDDAGFPMPAVVKTQTAVTAAPAPNTSAARNNGNPTLIASASRPQTSVRPVARTSSPTRELVAFAAGSARLFSSRAPVSFMSDDEQGAPVRFNEKPYRGRLEVFTNPGGTLTVVNVIALEDYVRGVVPNELPPATYNEIEALKAQAIAARTYAVRRRSSFAAQGFDLLPTTRSQVYGGLSTEHPLATRAVEETRGLIATYNGEPIDALYTSTCGGRTEDAENIFGEAAPYLRGRECALEGRNAFVPFRVTTSREPAEIRAEENVAAARDLAVLAVHDFNLPARVTDAWLSQPASIAEARGWLSIASRLARQALPSLSDDITRPPAFSTALAAAVYGPSRADTLLDSADVEYLLSFRDAGEIPAQNRADVAILLRDGMLSLYPDASLRAREAMPRARMLQTIARLLESRGALQLQKGTTRPSTSGALVLRSNKNHDLPLTVSRDAYLFRAYGDNVSHQMRSLFLVGGEPAAFHVNARGEADFLEVRPAPNGAAADRFSNFTNWTTTLSLSEARARLSRWAGGIGPLTDLRVAARGSSRRVIDLELVGASGANHLRGGRIRSALGLREQLFVIDRQYDEDGRVTGFVFTGRGLGHGVGLCQVGAYGMARAGLTYDKILKNYYTGIELTKLY